MLNSIRYHPPSKSKRTHIRIISARHLPTNHALEGLQSQKCCYVLAHTTALATKFWELSLWFSLNFLKLVSILLALLARWAVASDYHRLLSLNNPISFDFSLEIIFCVQPFSSQHSPTVPPLP